MKKNINKKLIITTLRTALAILAIIFFANIGFQAYNWESWCPNNDLGCVLVFNMYVISGMGICMSLYGISPVFWTAVEAITFSRIFREEHDEYLEEGIEKVRVLHRKWMW